MRVKRALVRTVSRNYQSCVSSHPQYAEVRTERAREQHQQYSSFLEDQLGLDVVVLEQLDEYPDSCFVEDTVVLQNSKLFICQMGEPSRRGEEVTIREELEDVFPTYSLSLPNTLEGGDVIHLPDHLISGLTQRTNQGGIAQLEKWIGQEVKYIADPSIVHLKSYVTYLGNNTMLTTEKYAAHEVLEMYRKLIIPHGEEYAANTLTINGVTIIPSGFPKTRKILDENDFDVYELTMDQFEKCEGSLTCLSILF